MHVRDVTRRGVESINTLDEGIFQRGRFSCPIVSVQDQQERFRGHERTLTAVVFLAFLKHVLRTYAHAHKIYIVVDNAKSHHAKLLKPFLKLVAWKLELSFLPPYSPKLNPAEDLWKLLREKCTHNIYYEHFSEKIATVREFLVKCKNPSDVVRSRCNYK